MSMIETILSRRWGEKGAERTNMIEESFPDVNTEAVCRAILSYKGNFPPYPKDIERKVYQLDVDGVFMKAVRQGKTSKNEQLSRIRKRLMEDLS